MGGAKAQACWVIRVSARMRAQAEKVAARTSGVVRFGRAGGQRDEDAELLFGNDAGGWERE